ncbi:MAG: Gfo/Idh/MocA family oxidoreductase [Oscillospiraceae bacterium]|nr:Gfo/Idh/MocA family oxidoreductase [Oscillospiraceae bacterium]
MKNYRAAIIGYGNMGRWHYIGVCKTPRVAITGAYDIAAARCEAARADGLFTYLSQEALLADSNIDIVIVATPNPAHMPVTYAALKAGKAVIVEKPAAMNSRELAEMSRVSEDVGRLLTIHQNRRRDSDFLAVRQAVESGMLGEVFDIQSSVTAGRGIPPGWRRFSVEGGGMLRDWGVHLIDQMLTLFPLPVKSVFCTMFNAGGYDCEDGFRMLLTYENGLTACVYVGTSHFLSPPRWRVFGDKASMVIDDWASDGKIVLRPDYDPDMWDAPITYNKAGPTRTMNEAEKRKEITVALPETDYCDFYNDFVLAMDGERPLDITPEQALRVLRIMEAAFESAGTGRAVFIS